MNDVASAILRLCPDAEFSIDPNGKVTWHSEGKPPTKAEIEAEINRFEYVVKRRQAYPPIEDQLDILFHEGFDGWKSKIDAVKKAYPKQ